MGLEGEEGFPHPGTINSVNNKVNTATGSILVRGVFPFPLPKGGRRLLSPGMFVRIRLPTGKPHPALLVRRRARRVGPGLKYVYVLDAEKQGPVSPGHDRRRTGRRTAHSTSKKGSRPMTGCSSASCNRSRPRDDSQAGAGAHAGVSQPDEPTKASPSGESKKAAKTGPPSAPVSNPVKREVTNYVDFTGRTEAVHSVDIRPRVSGYLVQDAVSRRRRGQDKEDLLFVIDRRPYKAQTRPIWRVDLTNLAQTGQDRPRQGYQRIEARLCQSAAIRSGTGHGG